MNGVDEDFETRLREHLRAAAQEAPAFTGLRTVSAADCAGVAASGHDTTGLTASAGDGSRPAAPAGSTPPSGAGPRRRRSRWLAAAAAVLVLAGVGGTWWSTRADDAPGVHTSSGSRNGTGSSGSAACAALLRWDGRTYYGWGELARMPRAGDRLGTGETPSCGDGPVPAGHLSAYAIPGVPAKTAVLADGMVWVARSLNGLRAGLPADLRAMNRPVRCHGEAPSTMSGTVTGVNTMPTGGDFELQPPYTATFVATRGEGLPLDRYRSVTVRLRVTADTTGTDPALLRAALSDGRPLTVTARCHGTKFVATSVQSAS